MLLSLRYTSVVSLFGLLSALNLCRHYLSQHQQEEEPGVVHKTTYDLGGEGLSESQIISNLYGRTKLAIESDSSLKLLLEFEKAVLAHAMTELKE